MLMNSVTGSKASIFVRKTLQFLLFDEDDVCSGYWNTNVACLNCFV